MLQADDIALAALSVNGLQDLVSMCESYSKLWKFSYNPVKSKVMVFQKSPKRQAVDKLITIVLYGKEVEQVTQYVHVGIPLNSTINTNRAKDVATKMRGCLMGIIGSGINVSQIGCTTATKLYKYIVLPRCLYGTELWCGITKTDIAKLHISHRFCLKKIQSFPKRANSIIVENMTNVLNIEAYIDQKKLLFFGRLCRLSCSRLAKNVLVERVYQHENQRKNHTGPVHEMCRVLNKYALGEYLQTFLLNASFPDKRTWRNTINLAMSRHEAALFDAALIKNNRLFRFSDIYNAPCHVHPIWVAENLASGHRKHFRDLAKLNCILYGNAGIQACVYCNRSFDDQLDHCCVKYESTRELFWSLVINVFSVYMSSYLYNLSDSDMTSVILGKTPNFVPPMDDPNMLLEISAKTWQILAYERELRFY